MPNRILRDWTDSEKINKLSDSAEVFFTRLFMKADDHGCFHANPKILRGHLYTLRLDTVTDKKVAGFVKECQDSGLIKIYWHGGKEYLQIINFGQRLRNMRQKYPSPQSADNLRSCRGQVADNCRLEVETESERKPNLETESETETNPRTPEKSFKKSGVRKHGFRESEYFEKEKFSAAISTSEPPYCNANIEYYYEAALNGSDSKGYQDLDWMAAIKNWMRKDIQKTQFQSNITEPLKLVQNGRTTKAKYGSVPSDEELLAKLAVNNRTQTTDTFKQEGS